MADAVLGVEGHHEGLIAQIEHIRRDLVA